MKPAVISVRRGTCLALPAGLSTISRNRWYSQPAWKAIWPLFGATNQLLAALALLTFVVFLKASKVGYGFALLPAVVMIVMPMTALALMVQKFGISTLLGGTAAAMFLLGFFLMVTSWRRLTRSEGEQLQTEAS